MAVTPLPEVVPGGGGTTDPLSLVPTGSQYNNVRSMLTIMKRDFPEKYAGLSNQPERVAGWITSIDKGERDDDQIRDDMAQHILGVDLLMKTYNIDKDQANKLILGGNEGGMNFSDLAKGGASGTGQGSEGLDPLRILNSPTLTWLKDAKTGKWYAQYTLPGTTNQYAVFEAEPEQMKALFGNRAAPASFISVNINTLIERQNYHLSGNVAEMEGNGSFEDEFRNTISLALDQESLPQWIKDDPQAMAMFWVKITDKKSETWFYEQMSGLNSFKKRYPGLTSLTGMGLTVPEAVTAFTQFETQLKQLEATAGRPPAGITPNIVGNLLGRGYNIQTVQQSYATWKRMQTNTGALKAFNEVLVSQGKKPLTGSSLYAFLQGTAPQDIYDIYEASSVREAATATGFGGLFSAQDALSLALDTTANFTGDQAYQQFSGVAQQALRFRHELDVAKYGIEVDDLIDVSFGRKPRSGKSVAEIGESLQRASVAAEAALGKRVNPFIGFTPEGKPQARSFAGLRQVSA